MRSKEAAVLPSLSNHPHCQSSRQAVSRIGVLLSFVLLTSIGCQTFQPFAQKTHQKLVSAKQWASGGIDAFQNGRIDQAKGLFSRAAQQNPNDASVRENLALTLHENGETQQAILQMQHAVDLSNNDPRMLVQLGELYLDAGQWIPARRQVELALERDHRYAPAWVLSGKTEKAKSNFEQALADFQRAIGLDSDLPQIEMQIVDTYQQMGQPHRALSAAEQILSKHASDDQPEAAVLAKSVALIALKQFNPAIDILQTASEKERASSDVFVRLGQAQLLAGQASQARLTLNRGKQVYPNLAVFDELVTDLQSAKSRVASTGLLAQ